jgi:hypothetical protein
MSSFRREGDAVVVAFDDVEASLLRHLVSEVSDLLEPEGQAGPGRQAGPEGRAGPERQAGPAELADLDLDDLDDLDAPAEPPTDPVLARLLPDGYRDDADSAQEFRRLTESELRRQKRESAGLLLAELPEGGGEVRLDPETTERWLATLNDVRLALGTRLDVTEDMEEPDEDDPDAPAYVVYAWLTQLQDVLVQVALEQD